MKTMKDNKIYTGRYIPYDPKGDDFLNTLYDYIRRYGIKVNATKGRVVNHKHIAFSNSQVRVNQSFFEDDLPLLNALVELPKEGIDDVLRMVFDTLLLRDLKDTYYDNNLENKEFILIDDLDKVEINPKGKTKRDEKNNE